ncbi:MAG: hypothetical protein HYV63_30600 [Candidatus Schekmanbacteria bacterium]|nr:hypothetical protein [Candidatus Schekmanbacteria bacterium]
MTSSPQPDVRSGHGETRHHLALRALSGLAMLLALATPVVAADHAPGEDDWSLPAWVQPSAGSGFFSEELAPSYHLDVRAVDFTWRQLEPSRGTFSTTTADAVYGMTFPSWDEQLSGSDPFWLRLWISGTEWAPQWVQTECGLSAVGTGYENDDHLPIWSSCFWEHARAFYREVLLVRGLRADPRLTFVYVPGAFTWCEFDFDIISAAVQDGLLDFPTFSSWFHGAIADLVAIMNGENSNPDDDSAGKLVYTGEDYPFGPFGSQDDLLARDAVVAGMGIRTGLTELSNFHLSDVPAYGTRVGSDGHMVTDAAWPLFAEHRVAATENECFVDCGFSTTEPYYAVKMANLKALQLRMNWVYAVPGPSFMAAYPELWEWVRLSLGKRAADAPDAWVALREAEDRYWLEDAAIDWPTRPWVSNVERWLVQREVGPDGATQRGSEMHTGILAGENGTAYEGRATAVGSGNRCFYFDLDDDFWHDAEAAAQIKVTYLDTGTGQWQVSYAAAAGIGLATPVARTDTGAWRTATVEVADALFDDSLASSTDFRICTLDDEDLQMRFVRVVRVAPPAPVPPRSFSLPLPLFAADSAWRQRADAASPLPASDAQILTTYRILRGDTTGLFPPGVALTPWPFMTLNFDDYSIPIFATGDGTSEVSICNYDGELSWPGPKWPNNELGGPITVPAPAGTILPASPEGRESDGHLVLFDASAATEYDFWQATTVRDGPCQSRGGGLPGTALLAAGAADFFAIHGRGANPDTYSSARATGPPLLAGLIVPEDIASGAIAHALALAIPRPRNLSADPSAPLATDYFYPASTTETGWYNTNPSALAAGQRLRLRPTLVGAAGAPLDESSLAPITRMVLAALRDFGAYVVDNADGFGIYAEDIASAPLNLSDDELNALIGAPAGTPIPPEKTRWQLAMEALSADFERIPLAYPWEDAQDPATAVYQAANFEVVQPATVPPEDAVPGSGAAATTLAVALVLGAGATRRRGSRVLRAPRCRR